MLQEQESREQKKEGREQNHSKRKKTKQQQILQFEVREEDLLVQLKKNVSVAGTNCGRIEPEIGQAFSIGREN